MNHTSPSYQIESQLKKFILLLQQQQKSRSQRSSVDNEKLSIILSVSQPESSLVDKQNTNSSGNRSYSSTQLLQRDATLFKQLQAIGMTIDQNKVFVKIKNLIKSFKKTIIYQQNKLKALEASYQKQKKGTDQLLGALIHMDEAEKQVWIAYNQLNEKYTQQSKILQSLEVQNTRISQKIDIYRKDNQFMKKLVIVANQNYQILENKCKLLQGQVKGHQLSARSMVSRSSKTKKQSFSPSGSDLSNLSPRKQQFQGIYRKMVLRTLKSKCQKANH